MLGLLERGSEERFDRFTRLAAEWFGVPVALVTLVDANRQWFKSSCWWDLTDTDRDVSFCGHAILEQEILVIPDAREDPRFEANPLVTDAPHIRFYAGAVLRSGAGHALGTLCLIDYQPREFSPRERALLLTLASILNDELRFEHEIQSERRRAYENAYYDATTGLPNAAFFRDQLDRTLEVTRRSGGQLLVTLVEMTGVADVSSVLGEQAGADLMRGCAERLRGALSPVCTIARWREEMFALLLPTLVHPEDASAFIELVRSTLATSTQSNGRAFHFEPLCGAASYPDAALEADELLQRAVIALRDAANDSINGCRVYTSALRESMSRRVDLEHRLHEAIEGDHLSIVFQPIVDAASLQIERVEALCRWLDPIRGTVAPEEFITLAERSNLILQIDRFVLRHAALAVQGWSREGLRPLALSVNVSSQTLIQRQFIDWLQDAMDGTGLAPERMVLEVTENCLVADLGMARENIAACRKLGYQVGVDDFGTGFSSFRYLRELEVDEIKLDRVFIKEMVEQQRNASIANTIIALAQDLRVPVVAEGVETYEQLLYLQAYRCRYAQGYYFSAPVEESALRQLLIDGT